MDEKDLKIFIQAVPHYFQQIFNEDAIVDPPFLQGKESVIQESSAYQENIRERSTLQLASPWYAKC